MKKGQEYEALITEYEFPNKGIAYIENRKVIVKNAFRGQTVLIRIQKMKSGLAEGRLIEVIHPSAEETTKPACEHFGECGGCLYQTYPYETQLSIKEEQVHRLLDSVCKDNISRDYIWEGILPSPVEFAYRNKMEFSFGDEYKDGPLALGLHKKGSFYDIVTIKDCRITDSDYSQLVQATLAHFRTLQIPYYKKMAHEGTLRHLVVRQTAKSKEILVNLVVSSQMRETSEENVDADRTGRSTPDRDRKLQVMTDYLGLQEWVDTLCALTLHGTLAGVMLTINDSLADVVQADDIYTLYGKEYIEEELLGLRFKITPFSFFQTNSLGAEVLYGKAREYVGDTKDQVVFDLYSGTGTIAQILAPVAKKVIGVEIVEEAVAAAGENAKANGLANCEFLAGDVLKVIDSITDKPDMIVLDPPRDGIHPKALPKIIRYGVDRIVYISCKPTSLVRDLVTLQAEGYRVEKACCVDMFPQTPNIETVVLLNNKFSKAKDFVQIDVNAEDYYKIKDAEKEQE